MDAGGNSLLKHPPKLSGGVCASRVNSGHTRTPGKLFVKRASDVSHIINGGQFLTVGQSKCRIIPKNKGF